jgi:hypothetical protein
MGMRIKEIFRKQGPLSDSYTSDSSSRTALEPMSTAAKRLPDIIKAIAFPMGHVKAVGFVFRPPGFHRVPQIIDQLLQLSCIGLTAKQRLVGVLTGLHKHAIGPGGLINRLGKHFPGLSAFDRFYELFDAAFFGYHAGLLRTAISPAWK